MIYELMDDHKQYYTWILKNIYLNLGADVVDEIDIQYNEKFLYRSRIPDFIIGNEDYFKNFESNEYKNFITDKIKHFFGHEYEYKIVSACIIWLKLNKLFNSYSLMIMYNRMFDAIQYFPYEICYNNYIYIKENPENKIIKDEEKVYSSSLLDAFECFQINEFLTVYIKKIFGIKNYKLLNSELDILDTHDLNNSKYNNLRYLVFRTGLTQWQLSDKTEMMDFSQVFDYQNPPNYHSIRFSLFIAWALCQKILNKNINKINYIDDTILNINKLYNYYIFLINDDTGLLMKIIKWLDDLDWDEYEETTETRGCDMLKLLDTYDYSTIFNSSSQLYKAYYDYPTNPKIKIKDVVDDEYEIQNTFLNIESSIYDNLTTDTIDDLDDDTIEENDEDNNEENNIGNRNKQMGGMDIIGIYELKNNMGKIISTVPICKISNIIKHVR